MKELFVINIGRQLGSGGKDIGEIIARRLGIRLYDKELLTLAAQQSGLCPEFFEKADEKGARNVFSTMIAYLRSPFAGDMGNVTNVLSNDALFKIQSDVIRDLAARESCIFVGRCADYILRDHPRRVDVFISADDEARIHRLRSRTGCTEALDDGARRRPACRLLQLLQLEDLGCGGDLPPVDQLDGLRRRGNRGFHPGVRLAETEHEILT